MKHDRHLHSKPSLLYFLYLLMKQKNRTKLKKTKIESNQWKLFRYVSYKSPSVTSTSPYVTSTSSYVTLTSPHAESEKGSAKRINDLTTKKTRPTLAQIPRDYSTTTTNLRRGSLCLRWRWWEKMRGCFCRNSAFVKKSFEDHQRSMRSKQAT